MSDATIDELADLVNKKINIPGISEKIERRIIVMILTICFSFFAEKLATNL